MNSFFNTIVNLWGPSPKKMAGQLNLDGIIHKDILLNQALASLTVDGAPDSWDMEYFMLHLLLDGKICITDTAVGVVPLMCGTTGFNIYNRPTTCVIANTVLGNFERTIDVDCALIHLKNDYLGIQNIIDLYSYFLSAADSSIAVNLMNSKVSFIGECSTKSQLQSMKKMYDKISEGEPAVFVGDGLKSNFTYLNPTNTFIADKIVEIRKEFRDEFLALIGIANANTNKKERLISAEVNASNTETDYNIYHWLQNIQSGLDVANRLFNLNLSVRKTEFGEENGNTVQSVGEKPSTI